MQRRRGHRDDGIYMALLEDVPAQDEGEGAGPEGRQQAAARRDLKKRLAATDAVRAQVGGLLDERVSRLVALERELQGSHVIA
jgi:hypothetical protein